MRDLVNPEISHDAYVTLLTPIAGAVSVAYTGNIHTLTLIQDTTLTLAGLWYPKDKVDITVNGNFDLFIDLTSTTVEGDVNSTTGLVDCSGVSNTRVVIENRGDDHFIVTTYYANKVYINPETTQKWTELAGTAYTATPTASNEIATSDLTDLFKVGDVLKITQVGEAPSYHLVTAINVDSVVIYGVLLDVGLDISKIEYEKGNGTRTISYWFRINNDEILNWGDLRTPVYTAAGVAGDASSGGTYGEDIFRDEGINLPQGCYLILAKGDIRSAGSSAANPLNIGIQLGDNADYACEITYTNTKDNYPTAIDKTYYIVPSTSLDIVVDINHPGGNLDPSDAILTVTFFTDIVE